MQTDIQAFEKYDMSIQQIHGRGIFFSLIPILDGEALKAERRKIYVVKSGHDYLYVGEANTSIKTRFQRGFVSHRYFVKNNKARGGYKGYKWIDDPSRAENKLLSIYVAVLSKEYDEDREFSEAIEGELVFLIRSSENKWPLFQNEIHFNNRERAIDIANQILTSIKDNCK